MPAGSPALARPGALHAARLRAARQTVHASLAGWMRGDQALQHRRQAGGALLLAEMTTVTIAHSKTLDLPRATAAPDLLVAPWAA